MKNLKQKIREEWKCFFEFAKQHHILNSGGYLPYPSAISRYQEAERKLENASPDVLKETLAKSCYSMEGTVASENLFGRELTSEEADVLYAVPAKKRIRRINALLEGTKPEEIDRNSVYEGRINEKIGRGLFYLAGAGSLGLFLHEINPEILEVANKYAYEIDKSNEILPILKAMILPIVDLGLFYKTASWTGKSFKNFYDAIKLQIEKRKL